MKENLNKGNSTNTYLKPSSKITGSLIISLVIGHTNSIGTSFSLNCKVISRDFNPLEICESRVNDPVKSQISTCLSLLPDANIVESV